MTGRAEARGSMRVILIFLAMLFATLGARSPAAAADGAADERAARVFPRPPALEAPIAFWRAIFTQYSKHQVVLHDAVHLDKVYKVLDFRPHVENGMSDAEL